ncbi:MAG: hypothetical protein J6D18_04280, partial [Erysipelotrichaceae bacterium]|nr:hypothetical protein [Erysipelotrichaceae bacterium]
TFAGWDREEDEYGNIVYKAKWTQTVTYIDPVTGEVYMEVTPFEYGKEPAGPADPSRDGFIFKGWKRTVDAFGNIVYEAIWEPIGQVRPVTKAGVVQTDVPTHLGVWAALMSSATALFAGLGIRKNDEE